MKLSVLFFLLTNIYFAFAAQEITEKDLEKHISYLASQELAGRYPGTKGDTLAAEYIVNEFKRIGLQPFDGNYLHSFEVVTNAVLGKNNSFSFPGFTGELEKDFICYSFTENANVEAKTVFAGYGFDIKKDNFEWNDYKGIDAKGKFVIIFRGNPIPDSSESPFTEFSDERFKTLTAKDKGAAGVIFITGPKLNKSDELVKLFYDKSTSTVGIPVININRKTADLLFADRGDSTASLEQKINGEYKPLAFDLNKTISVSTEVNKTKAHTFNVCGVLPSGNENANIVIGGHYDHLGMGGKGSGSRKPDTVAAHIGADDNASGVAAIIEIAEYLSTQKIDLKRDVVFVAFGAEELGALGSSRFVKDNSNLTENTKAMINLDMVGRLKETKDLTIGGTGTSEESEDILTKLSDGFDLKLNFSPDGYGPSDHSSFYSEDIPVFFMTTGAHEDYHTPEDDFESLNFPGLKSLTNYTGSLAKYLATSDKNLTFKLSGPKKRSGSGGRYKVTLGIMPDFGSSSDDGLGVGGVRPGGPASKAGLLKGDKIVAIEGKSVKNIYDYMHRLKELNTGQVITVDIMRDGKKVVMIVQL